MLPNVEDRTLTVAPPCIADVAAMRLATSPQEILAVTIQWTELLDWTTGLDYWTELLD